MTRAMLVIARNAKEVIAGVCVFYKCKHFSFNFPNTYWSYLSTLRLHSFIMFPKLSLNQHPNMKFQLELI